MADSQSEAIAPEISYEDFRKVDIRVGDHRGGGAFPGGAAAGL